jgi:hypothetical protein
MKLSKCQKKLLKLIIQNNRIRLCEIYKLKYFSNLNVPEEADFLMKQGLITINKSTVTYQPTVEGKHFFELEHQSLFDRILTPISVTLLTELVLHVLKWLLSLIQ